MKIEVKEIKLNKVDISRIFGLFVIVNLIGSKMGFFVILILFVV